ncbi:MAG: CusA/CzcA family heavy metal efflux RND transporter [Thermodesulfobacteriota bacterium]|nr:MAG: CusA/CzcA family heavy metal efflux RND transporter [Thermodesulfobacteriota bacterium]
MIDRLIYFGLRQRFLIVTAFVLLSVAGVFAFKKLPIDAFPDVTNIQVQVITEAAGMSPVEVEKLITYPIEIQMTGLPRMADMRSLSKFGLSVITVIFEDDVDIYFARQLVLERLIEAKEKLPEGAEAAMGPISTGLGEVYQYTLEKPDGSPPNDRELVELRTMQDWVVRPLLKTVPGVTDVNAFGGFVKQYQVVIDPDKLRKFNLTLNEVFDAVASNNENAGGNIIEHVSEQYLVRGIGLIRSIADIEDIVVKSHKGTPIYIRDIASVDIGPETRQGALVKDGKGEAVGGIVMMLRGASSREVVDGVKAKVAEINSKNILPSGIKIKPFYDRTELVKACLKTVTDALGEGGLLVVAVLFLFLGNIRSALIVATTLPVAALITFIVMQWMGLTANLMSLGGLAIAVGMMVDGSVVMIENIFRDLSEKDLKKESRLHVIFESAKEVGRPIVFGVIIIIIVFLPLFTLQGMEGKMFSPMAYTISIALFASLVISLTLSPVLASLFLKGGSDKDVFLLRWLKRIYMPLLAWSLKRKFRVLAIAIAALAASLALFPFLGAEFIPSLDEGSLTTQVIRLPSISLPESIEIEKKVQQTIMRFPEVESMVSKIGSAEIATDPMGPNVSDPIVILKPREEWTTAKTKEELVEKIREELEKIPGVGFNITQPIALRVDELISGVKSQIAIKIFGDDMDVLRKKAEEISRAVSKVRGVADLRVEQTAGQPYLTVDIDRRKIARYGINVADIQEIVETAIGGKSATEVFEGDRRFAVLLRFPENRRNSVDAIENIFLRAANGADIPLGSLAKVSISDGPVQVSREMSKRRIVVESNVDGRDIGGFVQEAQERIASEVTLPPGYYITWGGAFENQQRAMKRLSIIVPLTIALIFFILFSAFNSLKYAALIILNLPFALIGGIVGLWISGQYLSVPASVGFIALFGVAVLNGVVLVSYINKLREEGLGLEESILTGCERRLRPVLMTALVAILGLIPMLFATGPGSEIQKPLATVVIGGLITSTLLTLIVLPTLYRWFEEKKVEY